MNCYRFRLEGAVPPATSDAARGGVRSPTRYARGVASARSAAAELRIVQSKAILSGELPTWSPIVMARSERRGISLQEAAIQILDEEYAEIEAAEVRRERDADPGPNVDESGRRYAVQDALRLSHQVLIRIRSLCSAAGTHDLHQSVEVVRQLADAAHNLPILVASLGENEWASDATLASYCRECEEVLRMNAS